MFCVAKGGIACRSVMYFSRATLTASGSCWIASLRHGGDSIWARTLESLSSDRWSTAFRARLGRVLLMRWSSAAFALCIFSWRVPTIVFKVLLNSAVAAGLAVAGCLGIQRR